MATHSSILAWKIPGTEEPDGLQPMGVTKSRTRLKWLSMHAHRSILIECSTCAREGESDSSRETERFCSPRPVQWLVRKIRHLCCPVRGVNGSWDTQERGPYTQAGRGVPPRLRSPQHPPRQGVFHWGGFPHSFLDCWLSRKACWDPPGEMGVHVPGLDRRQWMASAADSARWAVHNQRANRVRCLDLD